MTAHMGVVHRRFLLGQIYVDPPLLRRELDRIRKKIDQYLIETHAVTAYHLRIYILNEDVKMLVLVLDLRLNDIDQRLHNLSQRQDVHIH